MMVGWEFNISIDIQFIRARERADLPITWLQQSDTCGYLTCTNVRRRTLHPVAQDDLWNDTWNKGSDQLFTIPKPGVPADANGVVVS
jgi:hypothetical protein